MVKELLTPFHIDVSGDMYDYEWSGTEKVRGKKYTCGYCNTTVSPSEGYLKKDGYETTSDEGCVLICPECSNPTYIFDEEQYPYCILGSDVAGIPYSEVEEIYNEARICLSASAYTAATMCCRKALMNVAVKEGAEEDCSFSFYVSYLSREGHINRHTKKWVNKIKDLGNEANHVIKVSSKEEAQLAVTFLGTLLKSMYEMPYLMEKSNEL